MSPATAAQKRRRVLIEVPPSLEDRMRLWTRKLFYPRTHWFVWGCQPSQKVTQTPAAEDRSKPGNVHEL